MTPLEQLIVLLRAIDGDNTYADNYDTVLNNQEATNLACKALIDDEGSCVWENHEILEEMGFSVFPIERDRFGWLTAGIQTKKGFIIYG